MMMHGDMLNNLPRVLDYHRPYKPKHLPALSFHSVASQCSMTSEVESANNQVVLDQSNVRRIIPVLARTPSNFTHNIHSVTLPIEPGNKMSQFRMTLLRFN
jgi:hypothetical protein